MASVTSLDKDLHNLRLSRYTPQAAAEVRRWIEDMLQERLPAGDLLAALKDGTALCRLVNMTVYPGVKYKQSSMPFVQMENISHYLRACQAPPLSLPDHDVFQTVDLYESKDPAQVLQCIAAFSRKANIIQPSKFPRAIGSQSKYSSVSPHVTGSSQGLSTSSSPGTLSGIKAASSSSAHSSPSKPPTPVSTWSKKSNEYDTMPAWNIHQYGYMGGASQANQGVMFGAPRQIIPTSPAAPVRAESEKIRQDKEESTRIRAREEERARQRQRELDEEQSKAEEERRWEEETARMRENERRGMEEEKKRWDEERRQWEEEEQRRAREDEEAEERSENERRRRRDASDIRLNGQFLSQYQASHATSTGRLPVESKENQHIKELERELEHAKERERQYESERRQACKGGADISPPQAQRPQPVPPKPSYDLSSLEQERLMLRSEWQKHQDVTSAHDSSQISPSLPVRPLPEPTHSESAIAHSTAVQQQHQESQTGSLFSSNKPPFVRNPQIHGQPDFATMADVDAENSRRQVAQEKTLAGSWASKSLLEREMERERERQREWEENQKQTQEAAAKGQKDSTSGSGPGQSWDVHQYGFMGGDSQNRVGPGLGIGGPRRQIIGPKPPL